MKTIVFLLVMFSFFPAAIAQQEELLRALIDSPYVEGRRPFVVVNGKDTGELYIESYRYKIKSIHKHKLYYKVYAVRDGKNYLIVGDPDVMYSIKKRKEYKMLLCSFFPVRIYSVLEPVPGSTGRQCIRYRDESFCIDPKKGIWDIFHCLKVYDQAE